MFFAIRQLAIAAAGGIVMIGLLSGCVTIDPAPTLPSATVSVPTLPPIPIDTTKSFDEQVEELKAGFAKVYCPIRTTPFADAITDEGKRLWNEIAARAQGQGAPLPGFDPNDPKMCQ